ncbi:hypothetical protein LSCM1_04437 [Leishmania martiniquensis]|uniref:Uncharacterized protein n=1 Tax=Leishmania martiniquensis TaxID=1580590 RepID=A0A836GTS3_9TRYP|nr:hypothetical protein LSCM1_04437 [Leishmania martiniquensis]
MSQRLPVTLPAHSSGATSGASDTFDCSTAAVPLSHTFHLPATGYSVFKGSGQPGPRSSHPPTSLRRFDREEAYGGRDSGLQILLPCPPSRPQSSLSCLMSTSEGAENKGCADSLASASDPLYLPHSDSERLFTLSSTSRRSVYSVNASPKMIELLPFIDPFAGCKGLPCTCVRARPMRPRGGLTRSSVADFFTDFGTPGGTMSSSDVALERGVVLLPGSGSAQIRSSTLEPRPTRRGEHFCTKYIYRSSGSATTATTRVVDTIHTLTTPLPAPPLSPDNEAGENYPCGSSPDHGPQQTCSVPAAITPHSPVDTLALEGLTSDYSVTKSGTTVAVAAGMGTSPPSPATTTTEGSMETVARQRILPSWLEWQWESSFSRSASMISVRCSSLGCISPGTAAAAGHRKYDKQRHPGYQTPSLAEMLPHVFGAQELSFSSFDASGVRAWVEEATVDAPLDFCATTPWAMPRKPDLPLLTSDSSGSSFLRRIPRGEFAVGVGGILRSHSSFCHSRLGLPRQAKRTYGSSQHRTPPAVPSLPVTLTDFTKKVTVHRSIVPHSDARSPVRVDKGDAASVTATTSANVTTTAAPSTTRSTTRVILSQVWQSSACERDEESAVLSDMVIGLAPPQDAAVSMPGVGEEARLDCIRAMGVLLEDPDAPPFAKAATQRLHQLRRAQSRRVHSPPNLMCRGREDLTEEAPVLLTTTTSSCSCLCKSHSCITKRRSFIAAAAGAQGPRSMEQWPPMPSN